MAARGQEELTNDPNGLNGLTEETEEQNDPNRPTDQLPTYATAELAGVPAGALAMSFPAEGPNRNNTKPVKAQRVTVNGGTAKADPIDPTSFDLHLEGGFAAYSLAATPPDVGASWAETGFKPGIWQVQRD